VLNFLFGKKSYPANPEPLKPTLRFRVRLMHFDPNRHDISNTVLLPNEVLQNSQTGQFKVGDGETMYKDLPISGTLPEFISFYRRR
jgi:hypothetical protein